MAESAVVSNPGDTPVSIDREGHLLGGGEFDFIPLTHEVNEAVRAGRLVKVADPGEDAHLSPAAREAFKKLRAHDAKTAARNASAARSTTKTSTDKGGAGRGEKD